LRPSIGPTDFAPSPSSRQSHNGNMAEQHPYSIKLEPNSDGPTRRYCWSIYKGNKPLANSARSYATKREAIAEAERRAQIVVAKEKPPRT
jgi:hypothetical protein